MNYVYLLKCADDSLYCGWTNNLIKRYQAHQSGKGAKYTKARLPVTLVYFEEYLDKSEALKREFFIKKLSRKEKLELVKCSFLEKNCFLYDNEFRRNNMAELKFYICEHCKNIVVKLHDAKVPVVCCGEPMKELTANTVDAAQEKHLPVVTRENNRINVNVGSVDHPMLPEHYIEFIVLETANGFRTAWLKPGDHPSVDFYDDEPVIAVYEYCNLHGLWKTSI